MNIEYYKNFVKIAELGNISLAAKALLIAQPSLSKQIQTLEKDFGTALLKRNARNVELTTAGEIFYHKAKLICEIDNICHDEIHTSVIGNRGKLKIGITISYPDWYIEDLFKDFSDLFPQITYDIREDSSDRLMELLRQGIIEVAFIRTPLHINPMFMSFGGIEENFMAVYHKNNPWLSQDVESISITQLKDVPLSISHGFKERVEQMFNPKLFDKIVTPEEAAALIKDGMNVGTSGFTPSGYPKETTLALAKQIKAGKKCRINLWTGASVGPEIEEALAEVDGIASRVPYYAYSNRSMQKGINEQTIKYIDIHLSQFGQMVNYGFFGYVDVAIVEAVAITEDGNLILGPGVGNTPKK